MLPLGLWKDIQSLKQLLIFIDILVLLCNYGLQGHYHLAGKSILAVWHIINEKRNVHRFDAFE